MDYIIRRTLIAIALGFPLARIELFVSIMLIAFDLLIDQ